MSLPQQKLCRHCGDTKSVDDFYADKRSKDKKSCYCKKCLRERALTWARKNPERAAKRVREWHEQNPDKAIAHRQKSYASGKWREQNYKRSYGITMAQVEEMHERQSGKCAICGTDKPGGRKAKFLYVDHDHKTGVIRGLLCNRCNTSIGLFKDDPKLLMSAACYLMDAGFLDTSTGIDAAYADREKHTHKINQTKP